MADPLTALHKAIFTALDAATTVDVYDFVPQDAAYPYIEIGRHMSINADNLASQKEGFYTYITVWSEYKGQKEVLGIMEEIYAGLHRTQFALDTGRVVRCMVESRDTARDMDDQTFTGNVKLFTLAEH